MGTVYMRESGSNTNGGTSWGDAVQTFTGITTGMLGSAPWLVKVEGSAIVDTDMTITVTDFSRNATMSASPCATVDLCESDWTASANVTLAYDTARYRQGTRCLRATIAALFATGKVCYKALSLTNYSAYQRLSYWVQSSTNMLASYNFRLCLCSDTIGDVIVNTLSIPACQGGRISSWRSEAVDYGGALGSSIQSVALYVDSDPGATIVYLDDIIACKTKTEIDSMDLDTVLYINRHSTWLPSHSYSVGEYVIPTLSATMDVSYFQCVGDGTSDSTEPDWDYYRTHDTVDGGCIWRCMGGDYSAVPYAIRSINGTSVVLDYYVGSGVSDDANYPGGFSGVSGIYSLYKSFSYKLPYLTSAVADHVQLLSVGGDAQNYLQISGGWDPGTDSLVGKTMFNISNGYDFGMGALSPTSIGWYDISNMGFMRCSYLLSAYYYSMMYHDHLKNFSLLSTNGFISYSPSMFNVSFDGFVCNENTGYFLVKDIQASYIKGLIITSFQSPFTFFNYLHPFSIYHFLTRNSYLFTFSKVDVIDGVYDPSRFGFGIFVSDCRLRDMIINDATKVTYTAAYIPSKSLMWFDNYDGTGKNRFYSTDMIGEQGYTVGPYSNVWKIQFDGDRTYNNYQGVPFVKAVCKSGINYRIGMYLYKDTAGTVLKLYIPGDVYKGIHSDMFSDSVSATNSWEWKDIVVTTQEDCLLDIFVYAESPSGSLIYVADATANISIV